MIIDPVVECMNTRLSPQQQQHDITLPFSFGEVKNALFSMKPDKALGIYGMLAFVF